MAASSEHVFDDPLDAPWALEAGHESSILSFDVCPTHTDGFDCNCQGLGSQPHLSSEIKNSSNPLDEPDYSKFENWIPRFVRPKKACDYCRSRRLDCYSQRGETCCTPCSTLFRECSLSHERASATNDPFDGQSAAFLDTLHVVDENVVKDQGALTGTKPLNSKSRVTMTSNQHIGEDISSSTKRNGIRFPRHAVKVLRDWLAAHAAHPYPTEEEKLELQCQTELEPMQIANWLANARRRRKANSERPRPSAMQSPSLNPSTPAITIPRADKPWDELNPFERWKHSPPENEPALMTDIVHAVVNSDLPSEQISGSPSSRGGSRKKQKSSTGSALSCRRAASTTSGTTSKKSSSGTTSSARFSQTSSLSRGSFGSFDSGVLGKSSHRRRKQPTNTLRGRASNDKKRRPFQCTFCTDTFMSKYDWTRHEKSLHLSLEKWMCAPTGGSMLEPSTGKTVCTFCHCHEPTSEHLESHHYTQCTEKGMEARTFYRKDHLRQHLRLVHGCAMMPHMETWKTSAMNINSRCGFCDKRFSAWQDRIDHLAAHFKAGARMSEWKGCRGLDPDVAAQVMDAMPPYLIGQESVSPNPFSATTGSTFRYYAVTQDAEPSFWSSDCVLDGITTQPRASDTNMRTTCWEILTVRLARFATEQIKCGIVLTDEILQRQAREVLFDSDDPWNQSPADNPEWLERFKRAHGFDFIPHSLGGQPLQIPEDLELMSDLGLRMPFQSLSTTPMYASYDNTDLSELAIPLQDEAAYTHHPLNCANTDITGQAYSQSSRSHDWCPSEHSMDAHDVLAPHATSNLIPGFTNNHGSLDMLLDDNLTDPSVFATLQTKIPHVSSTDCGTLFETLDAGGLGLGGESGLSAAGTNYDDDIFALQWDEDFSMA